MSLVDGEEAQYDTIIDKGTLDSLLCGDGSYQNVQRMLLGIYKCVTFFSFNFHCLIHESGFLNLAGCLSKLHMVVVITDFLTSKHLNCLTSGFISFHSSFCFLSFFQTMGCYNQHNSKTSSRCKSTFIIH